MNKGETNNSFGAKLKALWSEIRLAKDTKCSNAPISFATTLPDQLLRHNISDEELTMISSLNRDPLLESFWGFLGIGVGTFIPSISAINNAYFIAESDKLPFIDLLQIVFCSVFSFAALVVLVIIWKRNKQATNLVEKIRNRKKLSDT